MFGNGIGESQWIIGGREIRPHSVRFPGAVGLDVFNRDVEAES